MNPVNRRKLSIIRSIIVALTIIFLYFNAKADTVIPHDTTESAVIKLQLQKLKLNYPESVTQFYQHTVYKMGWIAPDTMERRALDAMLLLDCVHQYGFSRNDFHPQHLMYNKLQLLTEPENKSNLIEKISFDILLTDAMITLINDLHFGKVNPYFTKAEVDRGVSNEMNATAWLINSMASKDFMTIITSVQPDSKMYRDLQDMMRLTTAQYIGDSYVAPAGRVRQLAINMERLRWAGNIKGNHIIINLPAHSLFYYSATGVSRYIVEINGTIPLVTMLETSLTGLWTGMQIGSEVRQSRPGKDLFLGFISDFKNLKPAPGLPTSISVNKGGRLAAEILVYDHSYTKYKDLSSSLKSTGFKRFILTQAVPVRFVYITCEMKEGLFVQYPDPYHLDMALESALFKSNNINQ